MAWESRGLLTGAPVVKSLDIVGDQMTLTMTDGSTQTYSLASGSGSIFPSTPDWKADRQYHAGDFVFARPDGAVCRAEVDSLGVYPFDANGLRPEWTQQTAKGATGDAGLKGSQWRGLWQNGTSYAIDDEVIDPTSTAYVFRTYISLVGDNTAPLSDIASWQRKVSVQGVTGPYPTTAAVQDGVLTITLSNGSQLVVDGTVGGGGGGGGVVSFFALTDVEASNYTPEGSVPQYVDAIPEHVDIASDWGFWPTGTFTLNITETVKTVPPGGTDADASYAEQTRSVPFTVNTSSAEGFRIAMYQAISNDGSYQQSTVGTGFGQQVRITSGLLSSGQGTVTRSKFTFASSYFDQLGHYGNYESSSSPRKMVIKPLPPLTSITGLIEPGTPDQTVELGYGAIARIPGSVSASSYSYGWLTAQTHHVTIAGEINSAAGNSVTLRPLDANHPLVIPPTGGSWFITATVYARRHQNVGSGFCIGAWEARFCVDYTGGSLYLSEPIVSTLIDPDEVLGSPGQVVMLKPFKSGYDDEIVFAGTSTIDKVSFIGHLTLIEAVRGG